MKSEKLWINGSIRRNTDANEIISEFAEANGISGRDFQYLTLLTEETLGMANQMLKDFEGEIWVERTAGGYEIILEAEVQDNIGNNPLVPKSPTGFMAKIAEMLSCSYMFENAEDMPEDLAGLLPDYMSYGSRKSTDATVWAGKWSLSEYRRNLREGKETGGIEDYEARLDELEKSIVARIADEVTIGIRDHKIRMVISKAV